MNLTDTELKDEQKSLLNLRANFFSSTKKKIRLWTLFWLRKHVQLIWKTTVKKQIWNAYVKK